MEEGNLADLKRCLQAGLLHGNLAAETPSRLTLNNLLQFARLAQLGLQYLHTALDAPRPDADAARRIKVPASRCAWPLLCQPWPLRLCRCAQELKTLAKSQADRLRKQDSDVQAAREELRRMTSHSQGLCDQLSRAEAEIANLRRRLKDAGDPDVTMDPVPPTPVTIVNPNLPEVVPAPLIQAFLSSASPPHVHALARQVLHPGRCTSCAAGRQCVHAAAATRRSTC